MIKIVTWKWDAGTHPKKGIKFGAKHVNVLASMMKRHLHMDHEMVCITDDPTGINSGVRIVPLWKEFNRYGGCFGRLRVFSPKMVDIIGKRFVSIDLDVVITGDITPLIDRSEDFVIWGEHFRKAPYCGSFLMMTAGARQNVYDSFIPEEYPSNIKGKWPYGTDQDHICHCLYPREAMWTSKDGVYNFNYTIRKWEKIGSVLNSKYKRGKYLNNFLKFGGTTDQFRRPRMEGNGALPEGARMVFFNGVHDPSKRATQKGYPWIEDHWR